VQWCPDGKFLTIFLRPVFAVSRMQHVSDLHLKFALRPHHVCKYGRRPICDGWDQARKKKKKEEEETTEWKYNGLPYSIRRPQNLWYGHIPIKQRATGMSADCQISTVHWPVQTERYTHVIRTVRKVCKHGQRTHVCLETESSTINTYVMHETYVTQVKFEKETTR